MENQEKKLQENLARLQQSIKHLEKQQEFTSLYKALQDEITTRHQIKQALLESENTLRSLIDAIPESALLILPDGTIIEANATVAERLGVSVEDLIGENAYHFLPSEVAKNRRLQVEKVIETKQPVRFEDSRNGRFIDQTLYPVLDSRGMVSRLAIFAIDFTERKESEEAYRTLLEHLTQGIIIVQEDHVVFINPATTEITGYTTDELFNMSLQELNTLIHPDDREQAVQYKNESQDTIDLPKYYTFRLIRKDGAIRWIEGFTTLVIYHGKRATQVVYVDNTDRLKTEDTLRESLSLFKATLESTSDGLVVGNQDGSIVTFNRKFQTLWNLPDGWQHLPTREQRISMVLKQLTYPATFLNWFAKLNHAPELESYTTIELKDGRILESHSTPYRIGKHIIGRVWSYRDVTEQKLIEVRIRESEQRLQELFKTMDDFVFVFNTNGNIIYYNPAVEQRLGYCSDTLSTLHMIDLYHPDMRDQAKETFALLLRGKETVYNISMMTHGGEVIEVQTRVSRGSWGNQDVLFAISRDITDLKRTEHALQQVNAYLLHTVDELKQRNQEITLLNEMGESLQQCHSLTETYPLIETYMAQLFVNQSGILYLRTDDGLMVSVATWGTKSETICPTDYNNCLVMKQGKLLLSDESEIEKTKQCNVISTLDNIMLPFVCVPLIANGETIGILHIVAEKDLSNTVRELWSQLADTTANKLALEIANLQLRERLRQQSFRDPLTGLFNRRYLDETLQREIKRANRYHHPIGIIMLDIDHFKKLNDTYGHDGGDTVLRNIGTLLHSQVRGEDIACRYGGEEFTLILPSATLHQTTQRAELFREQIAQLDIMHNGTLLRKITASLGVACFPDHGTTDDTVMKAADTALYEAKHAGRNRVVVANLK